MTSTRNKEINKQKNNASLKNDHKFKKKKLNNLLNNPKHQDLIKQLELLLANKGNWAHEELKIIFTFLYNDFDVTSVYGYQLEKALIAFIDGTKSSKDVQLSSMCMSRIFSYKRPNNLKLIDLMLNSFTKTVIQLFDYFKAPTNLNDIKLSVPDSSDIFPEMIINDDNDVWTIVNRIDFILSSIRYCFDGSNNKNIQVPFNDIVKLSLAFLSDVPSNVNGLIKRNVKETLFIIHTSALRLLTRMTAIFELRCCWIGYIQNMIEIVIGALDNNETKVSNCSNTYLSSLLTLMYQITIQDGVLCLSKITTLVAPLTNYLLHSTNDTASMISLNILSEILGNNFDRSINKCVKTCSGSLRTLLSMINESYCRRTDAYVLAAFKLTQILSEYTLEKEAPEEIVYEDEEEVEAEVICDNEEMSVVNECVEEVKEVEQSDNVVMDTIDVCVDDTAGSTEIVTESASMEDICAPEHPMLSRNEEIVAEQNKIPSLEEMLMSFVPI